LRTSIIYDDIYLAHDTGPSHPESRSRLEAILKGLERSKLLQSGECTLVTPRKASREELRLVHDPSYINLVEDFCSRGGGLLGSWGAGVVCSPRSFEAALYAVGGALKGCELILNGKFVNSFALVRPPGHHAGRDYPYGFCLFNNIAIAAAYLIEKQGYERVMILDLDAHHGNGVQEIFDDTSKVFYVSFHQDQIFPGTGHVNEIGVGDGVGYKVNFPLPPHTSDEVYMKMIREVVSPITKQYRPQFILVSAGFDAHQDDPLTGLGLSAQGYVNLFEKALEFAGKNCAGKLLATLEGGYEYIALAKTVPAVIGAMAGIPLDVREKTVLMPQTLKAHTEEIIATVKRTLLPYWNLS